MAANYCIDYFKSKSYRIINKTTILEDDVSLDEHVQEDLIKKEMVHQIKGIMKSKLKKKHLVVMQLYYFAELEVNEIAVICDIPVKTVYSILRLSISKIKLEMEGKYD